jgi:hypothetical protein
VKLEACAVGVTAASCEVPLRKGLGQEIIIIIIIKVKVKVKQSHYRPGQAHRVSEG